MPTPDEYPTHPAQHEPSEPPTPEPEAPQAPEPERFPRTRAVLADQAARPLFPQGHDTRTRQTRRVEHAIAVRAYEVKEAFYRDTRELGNNRQTIAAMALNDIRAFVIQDDVTRGREPACALEDVSLAAVHVEDLRGQRSVMGAERRWALLAFRQGVAPDHLRYTYMGRCPVTVDAVVWPEEWADL